MNEDKTVLYLRDVPARFKANFKAACARRNISMRDAAYAMIQLFGELAAEPLTGPKTAEADWIQRVLNRVDKLKRDKARDK